MAPDALLTVRGLTVRYPDAGASVIDGLDLDLAAGECLAVVGPSGCGKSTLCRALLDLLPAGTRRTGSIRWQGRELTGDRRRWHGLRGRGLGLVAQDHRFALDPVRRVGDQVAEVLRVHGRSSGVAAPAARVVDLLAEVRLPDPLRLARRYPHQLSGGQRQRANLAAALAADPRVLLADEPTTALDMLAQRDIVLLLRDLMARRGLGLLLVTHDADLVQLLATRIMNWPAAAPPPSPRPPAAPVRISGCCLRARGVAVDAPGTGPRRRLVHPLDLDLHLGQTVGVAGESGAGKTTLARALAGWLPLAAGSLELAPDAGWPRARRRRAVQLVSQDAAAALDPRQSLAAAVQEAARAAGHEKRQAAERSAQLLQALDLDPETAGRRPHAASGGQRQRAQLARALAASPLVVIADEPASSLDPERRRRLLDLLAWSQREHGLALVLISHDLAMLEQRCDRIIVLHAGHLVECYRPGQVGQPRHPLTCDLAAAAPARLAAAGSPASTGSPASAMSEALSMLSTAGCPYADRCRIVEPGCRLALPPLRARDDGHLLRCPPSDHHAG